MRKTLVIMVICFLMIGNLFANESNNKGNVVSDEILEELIITHSEDSNEEKYVQNLANELNVSYEEAYAINKKENEKYLKEKKAKGFETAGLDEIIAYKTVYGHTEIRNTPNYVVMAVEVKYIYSQATSYALEIMSVGAPHMYIPGASSCTISGGDYNKEVNKFDARISRTVSFVYEVSSTTSISIGGDVANWEYTSILTKIVTTHGKTIVMNIDLSKL